MASKPPDDDDMALWHRVTQNVTPLKDRGRAPAVQPHRRQTRQSDPRPMPDLMAGSVAAPPGGIDRKSWRALSRGKRPIDTVVDLHGLTQDQAYDLLKRQIQRAAAAGQRTMLVITGKGGRRFAQTEAVAAQYRRRSDFGLEGGVLRNRVPEWLRTPDFAALVQGYGSAAPDHGGAGALYVLLRRMRGS